MTDTEHKNASAIRSGIRNQVIEIRQAYAKDMPHVLNWVNDPELWYVDGIGAFQHQTSAQFRPVWQELLQHSSAWMVLCDGEPVGQVGWVESPQSLHAEIYVTIGDANLRRCGIGRHAVGWLEQRAAVMGIRHLVARVLEVNEGGLHFFNGLGYRPKPSRTTDISRGDEVVALHWLEKSVPLAAS